MLRDGSSRQRITRISGSTRVVVGPFLHYLLALRRFCDETCTLSFASTSIWPLRRWPCPAARGREGGLGEVVAIYGVSTVISFAQCHIVSNTDIEEMLQRSCCAAGPGGFTQLWAALNNGLESLVASGIVGAAGKEAITAMFFNEYQSLDPSPGSRCKAPSLNAAAWGFTEKKASPTPGGTVGVWKAIGWYHDFAKNHLGADARFFQAVLECCADAKQASFSQLLALNLAAHHARGYVTRSFAEEKLTAELEARRLTLMRAESEFHLRQLLHDGVIGPEAVAELFTAGVPVRASFKSSDVKPDPSTNIIGFIEYWRDTLISHPVLIAPELTAPMVAAFRKYEAAKKKIVDASAAQLKPGETPSQAKREEDTNALHTQQWIIHEEYCRDVAQHSLRTRGGAANVNVNVKLCAQS